MNRRDFLSKFSKTAAVAGASAATVAAATYPKVRQSVNSGADKIGSELKRLNKRIDAMEDSHRRVLKVLVVAVSVTSGLDVLRLLNGDLI